MIQTYLEQKMSKNINTDIDLIGAFPCYKKTVKFILKNNMVHAIGLKGNINIEYQK